MNREQIIEKATRAVEHETAAYRAMRLSSISVDADRHVREIVDVAIDAIAEDLIQQHHRRHHNHPAPHNNTEAFRAPVEDPRRDQ